MQSQKPPWLTLKSADLSAEIDPLGAQLSTLRDADGRDLLWNGAAAFWTGRAPLLFPIVGSLMNGEYRWGAAAYALPRHGFARGSEFEVRASNESEARLRLSASEATRAHYPFDFVLDVDYEVAGAQLSVEVRVRNSGAEQMPASFGFHPGFLWPLPYGQAREAHYVEFEREEFAPIRRLNGQGLVAPTPLPSPIEGRRLSLKDELFASDVVIFDQVQSSAVTYCAPQGPKLKVTFKDTPFFGIWTKPKAPFVCLEPWHGISDPENFRGDFLRKPGVFLVPPGGEKLITMAIEIIN